MKPIEKTKTSSSKVIINEKVDSELLDLSDKHLKKDERTDEELLKQFSHHLDNGNKDKYPFAARLKGLKTIISKGFFEVPPGYKENKVIKSEFNPEEVALLSAYTHFSTLPGAKIENFMTPDEIKKARRLLKI